MHHAEAQLPPISPVTRATAYDDLPQYLTAREAAAYTGCSLWQIYQNIHQGHIPYRRIGPKRILIPRDYYHPNRATAQVTP